MDDRIAELLCEHCRPLLAAALKLERAELQRKQARDELKALTQGKGAAAVDDEADIDMLAAMSRAKQSIGGSAPDVQLTRWGKPRVRAASRRTKAETARIMEVPAVQQDLIRVIRGDFSPSALSRCLHIPQSTLYRGITKLIGARKSSDGLWVAGVGYKRGSKRGIDLLRKTKGWKEPTKQDRPTAAVPSAAAAPSVAPPKPPKKTDVSQSFSKPGRPGPNDPPKPQLTLAELKGCSNGTLPMLPLSKKYRVSYHHITKQVRDFKARYGADAPHRTDAELDADSDGRATDNGSARAVDPLEKLTGVLQQQN